MKTILTSAALAMALAAGSAQAEDETKINNNTYIYTADDMANYANLSLRANLISNRIEDTYRDDVYVTNARFTNPETINCGSMKSGLSKLGASRLALVFGSTPYMSDLKTQLNNALECAQEAKKVYTENKEQVVDDMVLAEENSIYYHGKPAWMESMTNQEIAEIRYKDKLAAIDRDIANVIDTQENLSTMLPMVFCSTLLELVENTNDYTPKCILP